jgi:AbrB family looped-hinge helix DNA binding protein
VNPLDDLENADPSSFDAWLAAHHTVFGVVEPPFRTVLQKLKYYQNHPLHMSEWEDGTTVTVTSKGQATIPKEFRDKLHIDTPGRVRFIENEQGEVVVRPVKRPAELRGALASEDADDHETSATEQLRDERERDKKTIDERYGLSEQDE